MTSIISSKAKAELFSRENGEGGKRCRRFRDRRKFGIVSMGNRMGNQLGKNRRTALLKLRLDNINL